MAVQDLWFTTDRKKTTRHGRGKRWRVNVPGHPTRAFHVKADAVEWERRLWQQGAQSGGMATVDELVELHIAGKADLTKDSQNALSAAQGHILERWGGVDVDQLQRHEIQAWITSLQSAYGPRQPDGSRAMRPAAWETKRRTLQVLRGAIRIAIETRLITDDPAADIRIARGQQTEIRILTIDELRQLAQACGRDEPMVMLMGTAGPRISEVARLDVDDVQVQRGRIRVAKSKSGQGRDVPVPATVLAMLDLSHDGPLFRSPQGSRINPDNWRKRVFNPAVERAGLVGVTPHALRHTAVSLMIASGASVKDVQAAVGHKTTKMTLDRYAHLWDRGLDDVARRMDGMLGG